jgi:DNA-binding NtrC family response regulator
MACFLIKKLAAVRNVSVFARNQRLQGGPGREMGKNPMNAKNSPPTVLIVDDEALIRWSLAETLGDHGYRVTEAEDGRMAVEAIRQAENPFDVVLLDFRLPDSSDLRLLEKVRRLAPQSQVIMITAHNSPELAQGAAALGAYRVISKPFEVDSLAALVNEARSEATEDIDT